jgi:ParB family chromosome partitioning protein
MVSKTEKIKSIIDLKTVLSEKLNLTKEGINIEQYFEFIDEPDVFVVKIKDYLYPELFNATAQLVKDWNGKYLPSPTKEFRIPKPDTTSTPKVKAVIQPYYNEEKPKETPTTSTPIEAHNNESIVQIPLDKIDPSPFPGRITVDETKIMELAASIQKLGILEPLIIRHKLAERYELIIGSQRLEAAKRIGMKTVPCIVRDMTDGEVQEAQLIENVQRKDFSDYEKALKLESMLKNSEDYPTQEVLAFTIGKKRSWIANKLRMLQIDNIVAKTTMLKLSSAHARSILEAPPEKRPQIVKWITESIEKDNIRPTVHQIRAFTQASETSIPETTIKHEGVEVQHSSEESKDESYQEHDKESVDEELESCVKCPKCGQIDVSHPTHTCSGCNNKWRVTQKDRLKFPKNKIPKRR